MQIQLYTLFYENAEDKTVKFATGFVNQATQLASQFK